VDNEHQEAERASILMRIPNELATSMTVLTDYLTDDEARALYHVGDAAHDFDHVWRVTTMAMRLARSEGADVMVVRLAALLHDVPVPERDEDGDSSNDHNRRRAHHVAAAEYARELLMARGLGTKEVASVVHCIEAHRYRDQSVQPQTIEAKCLYDADKLDSIGAIGVARAFAYAGTSNERLWAEPWTEVPPDYVKPNGAKPNRAKPSGENYTPVHEYAYKLRRILPTLHTESARRIGTDRHRFMIAFFDQLDAEMQGRS
jgi:uncharacterized protein